MRCHDRENALQECNIGDDAAEHLGGLLQHMPDLEELALPGNKIGKAGVKALVSPWKGTERNGAKLKLLDLSGSPFGEHGARQTLAMFGQEGASSASIQIRCSAGLVQLRECLF